MSGPACLRQLDRLRSLAKLQEGEALSPEALAARLFGQGSVRDDFVSLPSEAELVRVGQSFRIFVRAKLPPVGRARAVAHAIAEWCLRDEERTDERATTVHEVANALVSGFSGTSESASSAA